MAIKVKRPAIPKIPMPRVKLISGYIKRDGTYVAPYLRSK